MLKPQQKQQCLIPGSPPVYGKPWYWQRSKSSMESTRSLARVIMEMRDEIKKLETENWTLRGETDQQKSFGTLAEEQNPVCPAAEAQGDTGEKLSVHLRRNVSAPALEGPYKENAVMTVRRYSISSNPPGVTRDEGRTERTREIESGWGRPPHEVQQGTTLFGNSVRGEMGKITSRRTLQEYVHRNRAKVKTVTFLLPVDDIYTNRPALTKDQEDYKTPELDSIAETDS